MGHRCNLVVKRAGTVEVSYSQWGALSLLADLLKGPGAIAGWLEDCKKDEQLIDNVFSEGIALTDVDDQPSSEPRRRTSPSGKSRAS
jgi:hypothetical protein